MINENDDNYKESSTETCKKVVLFVLIFKNYFTEYVKSCAYLMYTT